MVYPSPGDLAIPVVRCPNHMNMNDPLNQEVSHPGQLEHVLWSNDPNAGYEKNYASGRVSTVSLFGSPHVGSNYVNHVYKFTCIGSCVGGINRRATSIIFTLEFQDKVIGRQSLNVRICSCPKRDKKSQESAFLKNAIPPTPHVVLKKKRKNIEIHEPNSRGNEEDSNISQEPVDNAGEMYLVPIFGYENFMAVSKFAEYLDTSSGALQNETYKKRRAQILGQDDTVKRLKLEQDDSKSDDELVIDHM